MSKDFEKRLGTRNADGTRNWPKLDVLGHPYTHPPATVRGVGGNAELKKRNTHIVIIPSGPAHNVIEAAVEEIEAYLALPPAKREKVIINAENESAG
jgi:hypothetical protein